MGHGHRTLNGPLTRSKAWKLELARMDGVLQIRLPNASMLCEQNWIQPVSIEMLGPLKL